VCTCVCAVARDGERCASDGGRGADVLPARHQPPHRGDAEDLQPREAHHLQHLPVLPAGGRSVQSELSSQCEATPQDLAWVQAALLPTKPVCFLDASQVFAVVYLKLSHSIVK